jgi:hypothetical protein
MIAGGSFWLATLKPHKLFVEHRVYYDESGEERSSGGYEYTARKKMDLTLAGPHPLSALIVERVHVRGGGWKKIWWPKLRIAWLKIGDTSLPS